MGGYPSGSVTMDPNGIVVTRQPQRPAAGIVVTTEEPAYHPHQYIWTGPVAAGPHSSAFAHKHPGLALALRELIT
jgi:hypothetical protein